MFRQAVTRSFSAWLRSRRLVSRALLYDCVADTPAGTIRTAEIFGLRDGKIASIRLVFDVTALRQVMSG